MASMERRALSRIDGLPLEQADIKLHRRTVSASPFALTRYQSAVANFIKLETLTSDPYALLAWLGIDTEHEHYIGMVDGVSAWQDAIRTLPYSPPLLSSSYLAHCWQKLRPLGDGDIIASLLIGDRWGAGRWKGSQGGLTALGLIRSYQPWKIMSSDDFGRVWLEAISQGAAVHLDLEIRLRAYWARAVSVIEQRKKTGSLHALVMLAMSNFRIDSRQVSRSFDMTAAGAIKLLSNATDLGLLIEQTGQSSYRSYSIPVTASVDRPVESRSVSGTSI